jgi:hypothetical protein
MRRKAILESGFEAAFRDASEYFFFERVKRGRNRIDVTGSSQAKGLAGIPHGLPELCNRANVAFGSI